MQKKGAEGEKICVIQYGWNIEPHGSQWWEMSLERDMYRPELLQSSAFSASL